MIIFLQPMNRNTWQWLARSRLAEAKILFKARKHSGAYYLSGYVIECALKARLSKKFKKNIWPNSPLFKSIFTHNLVDLLKATDLETALQSGSVDLRANWGVVKDWHPESRYAKQNRTAAREMLKAVDHHQHGIFQWLSLHW